MHVSIRALKANPSAAIARAQQGERVQITSHHKIVAELVPPRAPTPPKARTSDDEAMQALLATGLVAERATQPLKLGKPIKFLPGAREQTMSDLVIALRGAK